ncbi:MAG: hypothetical protein ASUL_00220 [Candidatus Aramenus sulfurataquae]|uniref:Uncharacterized protein n=1 Tax=Candidatus Aramenus sulfurataquae TaxID=1326980 RepID=W7KZ07_9CREN|nr:MAG: hypothetical protein ASUL_00220 [Candidatus Aramenus sulfurataquae]
MSSNEYSVASLNQGYIILFRSVGAIRNPQEKNKAPFKSFVSDTVVFLEALLGKRVFVHSYYYSVNLVIALNFAEMLSKNGKKVCIFNYGKIKWEFFPYQLELKLDCSPGSEVIVFEAESEKEVPENFALVTSYRNLKVNGEKVNVEKVDANLFKATVEGETYLFKIVEGRIVDYEMGDLQRNLLELIKELGSPCSLTDVVNIASRRFNASRDKVREELQFLVNVGKIKVKNKVIELL